MSSPAQQSTTDISNNDIANTENVSLIEKNTSVISFIKKTLLEEFNTLWSNSDTPLNKSTLMTILVRAMEIVETTEIKGKEQLEIVLDVLVSIVESDFVVSPHKDTLLTFLKLHASDVISIVVDASKGKININKLENVGIRMFKKIFACLR
jgi:hypothetical protein